MAFWRAKGKKYVHIPPRQVEYELCETIRTVMGDHKLSELPPSKNQQNTNQSQTNKKTPAFLIKCHFQY